MSSHKLYTVFNIWVGEGNEEGSFITPYTQFLLLNSHWKKET